MYVKIILKWNTYSNKIKYNCNGGRGGINCAPLPLTIPWQHRSLVLDTKASTSRDPGPAFPPKRSFQIDIFPPSLFPSLDFGRWDKKHLAVFVFLSCSTSTTNSFFCRHNFLKELHFHALIGALVHSCFKPRYITNCDKMTWCHHLKKVFFYFNFLSPFNPIIKH